MKMDFKRAERLVDVRNRFAEVAADEYASDALKQECQRAIGVINEELVRASYGHLVVP